VDIKCNSCTFMFVRLCVLVKTCVVCEWVEILE
jgi:hypothetical protein